MSVPHDVAANRTAALSGLHFNKSPPAFQHHPEEHNQTHHVEHNAWNNAQRFYAPPQQSRDASGSMPLPSPYHNSPPHPTGNVLVPNSSPLGPDNRYRPYQHYNAHARMPTPSTVPNGAPPSPWNMGARPNRFNDPLMQPSGFTAQQHDRYVSSSPYWGGNSRGISEVNGHQDDGPPRKRPNYGAQKPTSHDSLDLFNVQDSPPRRLGDTGRVASGSAPVPMRVPSGSGEELTSAPASGDDASSRRIFRGQRPSPPRPSQASTSETDDETRFNRFRLTFVDQEPDRLRAAWDETKGDAKGATALIIDSTWTPKVASPTKTSPSVTGRVKEVDEATKAQREAIKEKGKNSLIYRNRPVTGPAKPIATSSTPSPVKPTVRREPSPPSPIVARSRLMKKTRKVVVESESEAEASDAEDIRTSPPVGGSNEDRVFAYLNTAATDAIQELTGCTMEQAAKIIELRPFTSVDDLKEKLGQGKKKAGPAGISSRMFEDCTAIFEGYRAVDDILRDCEKIGAQLRAAIASWSHPRPSTKGKERDGTSSQETSIVSPLNDADDGALHIVNISAKASSDYLSSQPTLIANDVQLKDYQLAGLNWLRLLYRKGLSCILADEMGLGKTIQVISFFAHLKERGNKGPHLVVVPSSTLENWCREFARFAPDMVIQTYYAGKDERPMLRETLKETQACKGVENGWEVLITTYNLAQGDDKDRKFFKRIEWDSCVFDEGHVLKNFQSQRYQALLKYESKWRLLLTGTPLQNNLQELVSLMNFILPEHFAEALGSLRAIFKVKGDSKVSLLAQERVSRAKKMMTPFVLRRRKDQVLKDLPKKVERIEWCDMSAIQKSIYRETLQRSRKTIFDAAENDENQAEPESVSRNGKPSKKKTKATARTKDKMYIENSSNVLMDLRKAALHPMLFRKLFTDDTLASMTRLLMKEPDYKKRKAVSQYVREDLEVMTDAELQLFCKGYKSLQKFVQDDKCYLDAGKITVLLKLIRQYIAQSRRILVFSQFTQVLDILETILRQQDVKFVTLTGSTPVDARQALVDDFTEDESIPVFLLSTRAGGMGINLTAASVVVMYDQDFNPHNDRQAQDRAYRIGQKQDVDVVKLVTRGTIEEDMLRLGETKLALDEAVAGEVVEGEGKGEGQAEKQMKESLMSVLRKQFESEESERDGQPELSTKESSTKEADARSASPLTDMED